MLQYNTTQQNLNRRLIVNVGIYLRKSRAENGVQDLAKHKDYLINVANRNNWTYEKQGIFRNY